MIDKSQSASPQKLSRQEAHDLGPRAAMSCGARQKPPSKR